MQGGGGGVCVQKRAPKLFIERYKNFVCNEDLKFVIKSLNIYFCMLLFLLSTKFPLWIFKCLEFYLCTGLSG
jgi:hypothetical protein